MAGFVVNSVMFPTCLVFLTAKLVWTLLVLDLTRVLVLSVRHKERAVEKVLCQSQTWWWAAHSPQLQSGSKLPCFAPFSHLCVTLRLACPCTGTRGMGPIRVTHRLLLASSQHLWRHVFPAPGSHTYLWPSLPLISRFRRHPSGMAGENSTRHLVCDSTFPLGVSNRPLLLSAESCLLSHLIADLDVHSGVWEMSPCHLAGSCVPVRGVVVVDRCVAWWGAN